MTSSIPTITPATAAGASSEMEIEAVRDLAGMFGWTDYLGHLTSSGTLANLGEALLGSRTSEVAPASA